MADVDPKVLKLAKLLRQDYDISFHSRDWDALPPGYAAMWIENAEDLIRRMKDPAITGD